LTKQLPWNGESGRLVGVDVKEKVRGRCMEKEVGTVVRMTLSLAFVVRGQEKWSVIRERCRVKDFFFLR
jgi:hypothetical protein